MCAQTIPLLGLAAGDGREGARCPRFRFLRAKVVTYVKVNSESNNEETHSKEWNTCCCAALHCRIVGTFPCCHLQMEFRTRQANKRILGTFMLEQEELETLLIPDKAKTLLLRRAVPQSRLVQNEYVRCPVYVRRTNKPPYRMKEGSPAPSLLAGGEQSN